MRRIPARPNLTWSSRPVRLNRISRWCARRGRLGATDGNAPTTPKASRAAASTSTQTPPHQEVGSAVDAQDGSLVWTKRITWATAPPGSVGIGTVTTGERLALKVCCPRCKTPAAATIWRRFDYPSPRHPFHFTKCRKCHRRTAVDPAEVALLLLDAGITHPLELVPDAGQQMWSEATTLSVLSAETLLLNYKRAFGKKHSLTFTARSILADAVGETGDTTKAVLMYQQLLLDQESALRYDHPAVLANRYRAAIWTAKDGHPSPALVALENLLVDQEKASSPEHPNTLTIRGSIAEFRAVTGDREEAVARLQQLRTDQLRVLGSEHPSTESTQRALAVLQG